jgi:hypothetical protein
MSVLRLEQARERRACDEQFERQLAMVRDILRAVPRRNSELLHDLDRYAQIIIASPHLAFGYREPLEDLRAEVVAAVKRPADDERTIDDVAIILVDSLLRTTPSDPRWRRIAEACRPWVREDVRRATDLELRQSSRSGQ